MKKFFITVCLFFLITMSGICLKYHVLLPLNNMKISDSSGTVYKVSRTRLLINHNRVLLIANLKDRIIVRPSDHSIKIGFNQYCILLWPRNQYAGVIIGDGVKDDESNGFSFSQDVINIWLKDLNGKTFNIIISKV